MAMSCINSRTGLCEGTTAGVINTKASVVFPLGEEEREVREEMGGWGGKKRKMNRNGNELKWLRLSRCAQDPLPVSQHLHPSREPLSN